MGQKTIRIGPSMFYEKAVQCMEKYQYDKAIKFFQRVIDMEPDNPINYCNLAGALAETGRYEESNVFLKKVIEEMNPEMTECYFYMANNYANLESWQLAEDAVVHYLEHDEIGEYIEDCQEMLEYFVSDLRRPPVSVRQIKSRKGYAEHDNARQLLESGQFQEAIAILAPLVQSHPEFLPAQNNLALAYYYVGDYERAEQTVINVLEREPDNLHALCNKAILLYHTGESYELDLLLKRLGKLKPMYADQLFKLATTMGMLNRHDVAFQQFLTIAKGQFEEVETDACFYHYTAVAAFNLGYLEEARKWWQKAEKFGEGADVPRFYLAQVNEWLASGYKPKMKLKYHFQLPFSELLRLLHKRVNGMDISETADETFLVSAFAWALRFGEEEMRKLVAEGLLLIGDRPILAKLRELKLLPGKHWHDWPEDWAEVMDMSLAAIRARHNSLLEKEMESLWQEFYKKTQADLPQLHHLSAWSAALQYIVLKYHNYPVSYTELATRYSLSPRTIRARVQMIDATCQVSEKWNSLAQQLLSMIKEPKDRKQEELQWKK